MPSTRMSRVQTTTLAPSDPHTQQKEGNCQKRGANSSRQKVLFGHVDDLGLRSVDLYCTVGFPRVLRNQRRGPQAVVRSLQSHPTFENLGVLLLRDERILLGHQDPHSLARGKLQTVIFLDPLLVEVIVNPNDAVITVNRSQVPGNRLILHCGLRLEAD